MLYIFHCYAITTLLHIEILQLQLLASIIEQKEEKYCRWLAFNI